MTVAFDLYVLKSWDGNNQTYGLDRWAPRVLGRACASRFHFFQ
jgi:hypothetical protein